MCLHICVNIGFTFCRGCVLFINCCISASVCELCSDCVAEVHQLLIWYNSASIWILCRSRILGASGWWA